MAGYTQNRLWSTKRAQQQIVRDLIAHVDAHDVKKVLDVGCGEGSSTAELRKRFSGAHVIGVDGTASALTEAKQKLPNCEFMLCDISHDLDTLKEDFDFVYSNSYLHMFSDHEGILGGMASLLKDKGILAVQIPVYDEQPICSAVCEVKSDPRWAERLQGVKMFEHLSVDEYIDILTGLLADFSIWSTTRYVVMPGQKDVMTWYRRAVLLSYFEYLEVEERSDFEDMVARILSDKFSDKTHGGGIVLPVRGIYFVGAR